MSDYTELQAELAAKKAAGWQCTDGLDIDTVLALIAWNDVLTKIFNDAPDLPDTDVEWLEKTRALEDERDQLCAEVAGLRTGYEAYEQVNAELKAENEVLLSALTGMTSMYGHCWDLVDGGLLCMQSNVQRFEDAHEVAQKAIAALGQGEQS